MLVPTAMKQLHESHVAFQQPAGQQAVRRIGSGLACFVPVELERGFGLVGEIRQLRYGGLHPERHFVLRDARQDLRVAEILVLDRVELAEIVEEAPPSVSVDTVRVCQEQHRVADRAELDALVTSRQEPTSPEPVVQRLAASSRARRHHDDECRQIAVLAAQSVGNPSADRRPSRELSARLEEGHGRVVIDRLGVHGLHEAQLVGDLGRVRQ